MWQFVTPLMCVPLSQIVARYITSSLILHNTTWTASMWRTPDIVTICYTCYERNRCRYQTLANSPALDNLCCSIVKGTKWPIWCVLNFPHLCCVKLSGSHLLTQVWTLSSGQKIMCQGEKMGQLYHLPEKWEIFPVMRLTKDQRSPIVKIMSCFPGIFVATGVH